MTPALSSAKLIFLIMAGSYLLSAVLLAVARSKGQAVPAWVILGWALTGLLGAGLAMLIGPGRPMVWVGLLLALAPWMLYSLIGDVRGGHWFMSAVDVAGLFAIGYALWLSRADMA